jgi:hypothetical protein
MTAVLTPVDLKRHDKVRAWVDLAGVPIGTPGKVLVVSGVSWIRYRVLFENGVEQGLLDGRHIVKAKGFIPLEDRVEEIAVEVSADDGAGDGGGEAGASEDNVFGVPGHLLERAKKARARLSGG